MAEHIVTVPLVIAKQQDLTDVYLYEGAIVPDSVSATERERLLDGGFIEDTEVIAERIATAIKQAEERDTAAREAAEAREAEATAADEAEREAAIEAEVQKRVAAQQGNGRGGRQQGQQGETGK